MAEELQYLLERDRDQMSRVFKSQGRSAAWKSSEGMRAVMSGTERSQHLDEHEGEEEDRVLMEEDWPTVAGHKEGGEETRPSGGQCPWSEQ